MRNKGFIVTACALMALCTYTWSSNENDQLWKINSLLDHADNLCKNFNYDSALTIYDSALAIATDIPDKITTAYIMQLKAYSLRKSGNNSEAYNLYYNARKLALEMKIDTICAVTDFGLAHINEDKGSLDSAEYFFKHALADYENIYDTIGIGRALYELSGFYQTKVDYKTSLKYALESARIFKRYKQTELYCRSLNNLGNIYQCLNEYDTALACYELGKQVNVELNDLKRAAKFANNKAVIYYYQGKYEEAINEILNGIEYNEQINDIKELSIFYRNISVVYKKIGEKETAFQYANKALDFAKQINNQELLSDALINLGVHHKQNNNFEQAEMYYLQGLEIAEKANLRWDMLTAYENITLLYEAMNDFKSAYEFQIKFIDITDSINNIEQIQAREKYKAEYELLRYQDLNRIKELENKKIRFERNLSYGIGITSIILLLIIIFFFRMRARKNRIIASQRIQKLEDEQKLMAAQSVMVGEEKERERIARELHDGIGVLLSTASIHFSSVEEKSDKETSEMLQKANKLLNDASKEVRQISHNMMPGVLSKFGLREAIEDLCEDIEEASDINIELQLKCKNERLPQNMEIMIYRVIQEMLNNTIKHANASLIRLSMSRSEVELLIEYSDDGIGFEEDQLPHGKNIGLSGIRSRIQYLGGEIEFTSTLEKGSQYLISIPINIEVE